MDVYGNITVKHNKKEGEKEMGGLKESGTYVMRDGKLVQGSGEKREQVDHSNWYCSNADPEDIRKHREMMDRMHYRGP